MYLNMHHRISKIWTALDYTPNACICETLPHAKEIPEHGKISQVSFKQTNPFFYSNQLMRVLPRKILIILLIKEISVYLPQNASIRFSQTSF